jgi:hypothetical protein
MCQTRANHSFSLMLVAVLAATFFAGCNKILPTEPEDPMLTASLDSSLVSSEADAAAVSTRRRPARAPEGGTGELPTTVPSTNPDPTPAPPPPTPPSPPMTNDCIGPCDGIVRVPSQGEVVAAIHAARDRVRSAVERGELKPKNKVRDWNVVPSVEWKACYFWVENGFYYDEHGNRVVGACAAGMTDYSRMTIVISTKESARTIPLVKWEATNFYLYLIGRRDLLDRFQ